MTRYARNSEFLDQIYYAIGNLYLSRKDTVKAIENYQTAVEKSTRNGIDKALAQLSLGNLYFAQGNYVKAQPCYAEAIPQLPESYPGYKTLKRRSDVLDELAVYAGNVQLQDSLLTLSRMSPEEQMKVAERLARELIEKEKKRRRKPPARLTLPSRREKGAENIKKDEGTTNTFINNMDKSWYFYNSMTKNQGKTSSSGAGARVSLKTTGAGATRQPSRSPKRKVSRMRLKENPDSRATLPSHPNRKRRPRKNSRPKTIPINLNITSNRFPRLQKRYRRQTM